MYKYKLGTVVKVSTLASASIYVRRQNGNTGVIESYQARNQRYTVRVTDSKGFTGWFTLPEEWLSTQ